MDEIEVLSLIAQGENTRIDFKRELNLESAKDKAEFVKDVISLANTAPDAGYLLIGVDDNKYVVGIKNLEEERIQQIAHMYIDPAVSLRCLLVPIMSPNLSLVGVIEIKATDRPHKVAKAIERLKQGDTFVRRGSVVVGVSPKEITRMHDPGTQLYREAQQYIRTAEAHLKVGRWQAAITAYSKAIEATPTSELFLARGKAYKSQLEHPTHLTQEERFRYYDVLRKRAHKDFSDAIELATLKEVEKKARLERVRLYAYSWEEREKDIQWLKANASGCELGEVLCLEVDSWEYGFDYGYYEHYRDAEPIAQKAVALLDRAIEIGYREPKAYRLRAEANATLHNYGLALQDIDRAISKAEADDQNLVRLLCLRAEILVEMKVFDEAYQTLSRAEQMDQEGAKTWLVLVKSGFGDDILWRYALQHKFGDSSVSGTIRNALRILILSKGRSLYRIAEQRDGSITIETQLDHLEEECPGIMRALRDIVGERLWLSMLDYTSELSFDVRFQDFRDALSRFRAYFKK
jgi:tetratricopeptide (TPR) repeat protein